MPEDLPFQAVVFLGSFLTFSLELSVAKLLLPRFGGSAYVWTTCVMFFQAVLLAGYVWGHAALGRWGARRYSRLHLLVLAAPFFFFPLRLPAPLAGAGPQVDLLWALARAVGAPFLVLSTTIIVVQGWLTATGRESGRDGYFLFAASNLGALAALGAYPFLIEPFLTLRAQSVLWLALYSAYAALHLACLPRTFVPEAESADGAPVSGRERALWLLLSAAPCAAMLATTNLLTFDFAAVPLLWTAPLAVYLATFVLNFKRAPWYPGRLNSTLLPALGLWAAACLAAAALAISRSADSTPVQTLRRLVDIGKFGYVTAALFVVGMICHKSLAASRPARGKAMTEFYGWIAAGGLLGSLCIGVLVPELGRGVSSLSLDWIAAAAVAAAALALRDRDALARRPRLAAGGALLLAAAGAAALRGPSSADGVVRVLRNFYGVYRVVDKDGAREFFHGNTDHGMQSLDPAKAGMPLTYYNVHSPLAEAYAALGENWRSIGVVGLGAGAIAAYGRAGQTMDFYELDPDVAMIAGSDFTYLKSSPARIRIILGDARQSLARDGSASYDLLILDAFNSGAVPIHLVTKEALELYLRRIPSDGVVLLHVSNRYLDLRSMLAALARDLGLAGACKRLTQSGRIADDRVPSSWVALSRDPAKMDLLVRTRGWTDLRDPAFARGAAWTDQHASLLSVLAL
ncbi:MAG: fused MFS/spermidine synthase [Elusimicrobiota bacterium]